jgi:hypothetical protein
MPNKARDNTAAIKRLAASESDWNIATGILEPESKRVGGGGGSVVVPVPEIQEKSDDADVVEQASISSCSSEEEPTYDEETRCNQGYIGSLATRTSS